MMMMGQEEGNKGWTSGFIFKGTQTSSLHTVTTRRLSRRISISETRSNTKSQFSLPGAPKRWREEETEEVTEEKENQSGCLLSPPTSRVDLSSLGCPHLTALSYSEVYI